MTKKKTAPKVDKHEMAKDTQPAEDLNALFVGSGGQYFSMADDNVPLFEETGTPEEIHDPADVLDSYSEAFQNTVANLQAIDDWARLKAAGQTIFKSKAQFNKREYNFLMTEYKMLKTAKKPQITTQGKVAIAQFRQTLKSHADNLKLVSKRLYAARASLVEKGLNETEIDAMWQLLNAAKGGATGTRQTQTSLEF